MRGRDLDYIETRLLAPCDSALEAHGRLVQLQMFEEAVILMRAMQEFTDRTRELRNKITDDMMKASYE